MGGCLRPSRAKYPIYIELIDRIIADSIKALPPQSPQTPFPVYIRVLQKLHKKGDLRKLVDHLSSHRSNLYSCMLYLLNCLEIKDNQYAVLVVVDEMVKRMNDFTNENFKKPKSRSKKPNLKNEDRQETSRRIDSNSCREVSIRFEMMYFKIVLTILDSARTLRVHVMDSLRQYADLRKEKFTCDKNISITLACLLAMVKAGEDVVECLMTYTSLLKKSNVHLAEGQTSHQAFSLLLNLWINIGDSNLNGYCEDIFNLYLSKCMESREYTSLLPVIFQVYDTSYFKPIQTTFETKVLLDLKGEGLKSHFLKGLFKYLLMYLCMSDQQKVKDGWVKEAFTTSHEVMKRRHKNILNQQCKINGFSTMTRWLAYKFVDIDELVNFNRHNLYSCFRNNIVGASSAIQSQSLRTFVEVYKVSSSGSKLLLFKTVFEDIHTSTDLEPEQAKGLLQLANSFALGGLTLDNDTWGKILSSAQYTFQHRLVAAEMVRLYSQLLRQLSSPYQPQLLECLCELAFSFYQLLDIPESSMKEKCLLIDALVQFMTRLNAQGLNDLVLVWVMGIPKPGKLNSITRYFDTLLVLEIWEAITLVKRVPDDMRVLNGQIKQLSNSQAVGQIWAYERGHSWMKVLSRPNLVPTQDDSRYLFLKETFRQLQKRNRIIQFSDQNSERPPLQIRQRSSAVTSQQSYKTDQSFQQVFGMISTKDVGPNTFKKPIPA